MSTTSPCRPSDVGRRTPEPIHPYALAARAPDRRSEVGADRTAPGADGRPILSWTLSADGRLVCAWSLERPARSSELAASAGGDL